MKKHAGLLLVSAALLAGCSTTAPPETAKPIAEPANAESCAAFELTTTDLANRIVEGSDDANADEFVETMNGMRGRFDEASLSGTGDVKDRIGTLVENLPENVHMLLIEHDTYFEDVASIGRACTADGSPINPQIWR